MFPDNSFLIFNLRRYSVDAAQRGCGEIRTVQERRSVSGGALASTWKDLDDTR